MEVKPWEADRFLARHNPDIRLYVFYGPDTGLAQERALAIAQRPVGPAKELPEVVRIDGDTLGDDPSRLADEAAQVSMFGGERIIRVLNGAGAGAVKAIEAYLENPLGAMVTVEAGDIRPGNKLRSKLAKATVKNAAVIGCYPDDGRAMEQLVDQTLAEDGFRLDDDARPTLLARLGPDRRMNRETVRLLALYKGDPATPITAADVDAALGDSSSVGYETIAFACLSGDIAEALRLFDKSMAEKTNPIIAMSSLLLQFDRFDMLDAARQSGKPTDVAVKALRIFPKTRESAFARMVGFWPSARRATARRLVVEADIRSRSGQLPDHLVYRDLLLRLGTAAQGMARNQRRF
ncbi:MAG: DNA polymerase III subunit delta [Minwuia sp.]|nr:DNA polymerase III subunit delta [Minwuia sp.]